MGGIEIILALKDDVVLDKFRQEADDLICWSISQIILKHPMLNITDL